MEAAFTKSSGFLDLSQAGCGSRIINDITSKHCGEVWLEAPSAKGERKSEQTMVTVDREHSRRSATTKVGAVRPVW
jgi:hypothetical protein